MDKIILFLSIGLIGGWIGNLAGQDQYAQILAADASPFELIMGIVGAATCSCTPSGRARSRINVPVSAHPLRY